MLKQILRRLFYRIQNFAGTNEPIYIKRGLKFGSNVDILDSDIDSCFPWLITIGDNVTITGATVLAHDASTKKELGYIKVGRVDIGSNVFIGKQAIILPDTRIGSNVIIGAGSVVAKDIPDNSVVIGNPCRIICSYEDYMKTQRERMKTRPVYEVAYPWKSLEQKQQEFDELSDFMGGFDK